MELDQSVFGQLDEIRKQIVYSKEPVVEGIQRRCGVLISDAASFAGVTYLDPSS